MTANSKRITLHKGSKGADVKYLQARLTSYYGLILSIDGIFGSTTEELVKQFQLDGHLTADGIVGSETWKALEQEYYTIANC